MASEVDICNLALARLGDKATVSSIDPPEGSTQAAHCQRFYPIARNKLLELFPWKFATRRVSLNALDDSAVGAWSYAYGWPNKAVRILAILPEQAPDDSDSVPFDIETNSDDTLLILTNLESAWARYISRVTDPTKYSPLFIDTLSWMLAAELAGPLMKGTTGMQVSKACLQTAMSMLEMARTSDANQRRVDELHRPAWLAVR